MKYYQKNPRSNSGAFQMAESIDNCLLTLSLYTVITENQTHFATQSEASHVTNL